MIKKTKKPISKVKSEWKVESLLGDIVINLKKLKEQAKAGNAEAQYELGKHHYDNAVRGTQGYRFNQAKNLKRSKKWLKLSALQGHIFAEYLLDLIKEYHEI
jgi:TPR repeat protein